jgi:AraC-like DNA-binding protein
MLLRHDAFRRLCLSRDLLADVRAVDPPTVREVARLTGISDYHFIRQFEALFGTTPHQFRMQRRLELAKHLLAQGNLSVTEVGMEVGMSSLGSFSDLFAREFGVNPSSYRKHARVLVEGMEFPKATATLFPGCLSLMALLPASAFRNFQEAPPAPLA